MLRACFHEVVTKTESQLIAEGFDEEQVKSRGDYTGNTEIETLARDTVQEHFSTTSGGVNSAARLVRITEHYVRMDYEGQGRPCLYQIITGVGRFNRRRHRLNRHRLNRHSLSRKARRNSRQREPVNPMSARRL